MAGTVSTGKLAVAVPPLGAEKLTPAAGLAVNTTVPTLALLPTVAVLAHRVWPGPALATGSGFTVTWAVVELVQPVAVLVAASV